MGYIIDILPAKREGSSLSQILRKAVTFLKNPRAVFKSRIIRPLNRKAQEFRKYLSTKGIPYIPEPPIWQFPEGFSIHSIGKTGVRVVDNFLSEEEAREVISLYGLAVSRSTVIGPGGNSMTHNYRTSSDTLIAMNSSPLIESIIYRAATLFGLPVSHAETFSLTRYQHGEYYKGHFDHDGSMNADRLYTLLIYLNDLTPEEGGGTCFEKLNLVAQPVCGRAVVWSNSDLDRVRLPESYHASQPILKEGAEKWVAQLWFRSYRKSSIRPAARSAPPAGIQLNASTALPPGVYLPDTLTVKHD
jgi:prolyl 4-hydroxylase